MFSYPQLTASEQAGLPTLIAQPQAIPNRFADSTHALFYCPTADGDMVLKVCRQATLEVSPFWLGANHLFAADFPDSLSNMHLTFDFLQKSGALTIPALVSARAGRFVLTRFITGKDATLEQIADQWVIQLAEHIASLHQCIYRNWGPLHAPQFSATQWSDRLHETLVYLTKRHGALMTNPVVTQGVALAKNIMETEFVPVMLDLRWDQFRCSASRHSGAPELVLIDLDAFVIAPRSLDLVLLEYVLSPPHWALFKQHYMQKHAWPDLDAQKPCYQLLLFLMNMLGEADLSKWMQPV